MNRIRGSCFLCLATLCLLCANDSAAQSASLEVGPQKVIEQGLVAAENSNWSRAYSLFFSEHNSESNYPIMYFIAVSAARRSDPKGAFRYASLSSSELETLSQSHEDQRDAILYWARPSVLGTYEECQLPPSEREASFCEIDKPGALEALVEEYFEVRLLDLMLTQEWIDAEARQSCENAGFNYGDPSLPRDTKTRCEARRAFSMFDYDEHPPDEWHLDDFLPAQRP